MVSPTYNPAPLDFQAVKFDEGGVLPGYLSLQVVKYWCSVSVAVMWFDRGVLNSASLMFHSSYLPCGVAFDSRFVASISMSACAMSVSHLAQYPNFVPSSSCIVLS